MPVIISAAVSAIMITMASQSGSITDACLGASPFVVTFCYMAIFVTGRRPHFTRDVVCVMLNGRSLSPLPPAEQPLHPSKNAATQKS